MPSDKSPGRTTRITRRFSAPAAVVYRALLDVDCVKRWKFPAGMSIHVHEFEPREGGRFRVSLTYHDSSAAGKTVNNTDTYCGHFEQLVAARQVVEVLEFETANPSFAGQMRITYALTEQDGHACLVATHENVPAGVPLEDNELGWSMALERLAALVEAECGPPGGEGLAVADAVRAAAPEGSVRTHAQGRSGLRSALLLTAALFLCGAQAQQLPEEVTHFLKEREACEHFLGEPVEGRTAEQRQRRDFVADSIDIHCAGTDKRLAALKRRYAGNHAAMAVLRPLQERLE
jgi:uncharacterized protein YndB with AHSA1/START domain